MKMDQNSSKIRPACFGQAEFSGEEHAAIQAALRRKLGPEFISQRRGQGGQMFAYVEGWRLVNIANQMFGFNGWSSSVTQQTVDFVDVHSGKYYVGVSASVKVQLKDGVFHEDTGYGTSEGMRSKALALEKARKEAVTDGMKRALKSFGNALGNCLGDQEYLKYIAKSSKTVLPPINPEDLKHTEGEEAVTEARYQSLHKRKTHKMETVKAEGNLQYGPQEAVLSTTSVHDVHVGSCPHAGNRQMAKEQKEMHGKEPVSTSLPGDIKTVQTSAPCPKYMSLQIEQQLATPAQHVNNLESKSCSSSILSSPRRAGMADLQQSTGSAESDGTHKQPDRTSIEDVKRERKIRQQKKQIEFQMLLQQWDSHSTTEGGERLHPPATVEQTSVAKRPFSCIGSTSDAPSTPPKRVFSG